MPIVYESPELITMHDNVYAWEAMPIYYFCPISRYLFSNLRSWIQDNTLGKNKNGIFINVESRFEMCLMIKKCWT